MTAKEWLRRGWKIDREINSLLSEKTEMLARLTSITAQLDRTPVQGTKDPHKFDAVAAYDAEIDKKIDALVEIKREIEAAIGEVEDGTQRTLLRERYLRFRTWEQIAVDMSYTWRWTLELHGRALQAIEPIIETKHRSSY